MNRAIIFAAAVAWLGAAACAGAADWILAPSTFTHDPQTGARVAQYAPIEPVYVESRPDYLKSGYRHHRSSIYSGDGADHHHVVEQWGRPVRPYGEWLYPYRPYSVPYHLWGPPFAGLGAPHYGGARRGFAPGLDPRTRPALPPAGERGWPERDWPARDVEAPRAFAPEAPPPDDFRLPPDGARGPTGYGGRT